MAKSEKEDERGRVWTFVFYPDSAPKEWRSIIDGWHTQAFVSPLHDKDLNGDNEEKKPHYHVVLVFGGNKSADQIQKYSNELSKVKIIAKKNKVADKRIMVRYLVHYDNPEKFQYDIDDIVEFGGADKLVFFAGEKEDDTAVREMMNWAREQGIYSFAALADYAAAERPEWFRVLVSRRSYFMDKYLKSLAYEMRS